MSSVEPWTTISVPQDSWTAIAWSPKLGLFCAVSTDGSKRVITSPDGQNWTAVSVPTKSWRAITWSPELELFCAVSGTGSTGDRVMTSADGENWSTVSVAENNWDGIAWSPELELFCAVATSGTQRLMTSPDGVIWTPVTIAENSWRAITWSSSLGLFCAVASSGTNRVITSSDGITWTPVLVAIKSWYSITWSPELDLFCAVGSTAVMTSSDGADWDDVVPDAGVWISVAWAPEVSLFCAVTWSGTNRLMTSPDGAIWTSLLVVPNFWLSVAWSPELKVFVAVASVGTDRVIISTAPIEPGGWDFIAVDRWGVPIDLLGASNADVIEGTNLTRYMTPANMPTILEEIEGDGEGGGGESGDNDGVITNIPIINLVSQVDQDVNSTSPGLMMKWNRHTIINTTAFSHDASTNTERIIVNQDGLYHLSGVITLENFINIPSYRCEVTVYRYNSIHVEQDTFVTEQGFLWGDFENYYMAISLDVLTNMDADDYFVIGIARVSTDQTTNTHTFNRHSNVTVAQISTLTGDGVA